MVPRGTSWHYYLQINHCLVAATDSLGEAFRVVPYFTNHNPGTWASLCKRFQLLLNNNSNIIILIITILIILSHIMYKLQEGNDSKRVSIMKCDLFYSNFCYDFTSVCLRMCVCVCVCVCVRACVCVYYKVCMAQVESHSFLHFMEMSAALAQSLFGFERCGDVVLKSISTLSTLWE